MWSACLCQGSCRLEKKVLGFSQTLSGTGSKCCFPTFLKVGNLQTWRPSGLQSKMFNYQVIPCCFNKYKWVPQELYQVPGNTVSISGCQEENKQKPYLWGTHQQRQSHFYSLSGSCNICMSPPWPSGPSLRHFGVSVGLVWLLTPTSKWPDQLNTSPSDIMFFDDWTSALFTIQE